MDGRWGSDLSLNTKSVILLPNFRFHDGANHLIVSFVPVGAKLNLWDLLIGKAMVWTASFPNIYYRNTFDIPIPFWYSGIAEHSPLGSGKTRKRKYAYMGVKTKDNGDSLTETAYERCKTTENEIWCHDEKPYSIESILQVCDINDITNFRH